MWASPLRAYRVRGGRILGWGALRRGGRRAALGDQLDDLAHDPVDVEVLRRVDAVDALLAQQAHGLGDQLEVGAGEDREADHVDVLLDGGGGDLRRGQADTLVD